MRKVITYHYKSDRIKEIYYVNLKGVINGLYQCFHPNGNIHIRCTYKNGKFHGEYKSYYKDGNPNIICSFYNDQLIDQFKSYYSNHQLKSIYNYRYPSEHDFFGHVSKHSVSQSYLSFKMVYGIPYGESRSYFEDGQTESICYYGSDSQEYIQFYPNGNLAAICTMKNDYPIGEHKNFSFDGELTIHAYAAQICSYCRQHKKRCRCGISSCDCVNYLWSIKKSISLRKIQRSFRRKRSIKYLEIFQIFQINKDLGNIIISFMY